MTLPDGTSWLEHFTTAIQLITAINVTYIFTHFPKRIYDSIFNYEETRRQKYALFKDTHLSVLENDLDNMEKKKVLGQTLTVPAKLKSEVVRVKEQWESWAKWSDNLIKRTKEVKGVKCLFLFVSVYCFLNLLGIGVINVWSTGGTALETLCAYNIVSAVFSLLILIKVLSGAWNSREDNECYDSTRRYIGWGLILTVILCIVNSIFIHFGNYIVAPRWIVFFMSCNISGTTIYSMYFFDSICVGGCVCHRCKPLCPKADSPCKVVGHKTQKEENRKCLPSHRRRLPRLAVIHHSRPKICHTCPSVHLYLKSKSRQLPATFFALEMRKIQKIPLFRTIFRYLSLGFITFAMYKP